MSLSGRQIFIASPGGLDAERQRVRETVDEYNRSLSSKTGVAFITRGWEEIPGGLGRPQALINQIIDDCDFTVVLLADRWGSAPGLDAFSSGTEEELMHSLALRATPDVHMRDVLVLFKSIPDAQLADPGSELSKVLAFKKRLEKSKEIFYGTFDSLDALQQRLEKALGGWDGDLKERDLQTIVLPEVGVDEPEAAEPEEPLARAIKLAASGQLVQAEVVFAQAIRNSDPEPMTQYARFLRRQGRLNDSRDMNLRVVDTLTREGAISPERTGFLSDSLANVGVILRKQGKLSESARTLGEAIDVARNAGVPLPEHLAYALDNLGHTQSQLDDRPAAAASFAEAARTREGLGGSSQIASLLNAGWAAIRLKNFPDAEVSFESAARLAREADDEPQLAHALAGVGSCLEKSGKPNLAIEPLEQALEINLRMNASDGVGIAAGLLARSYIGIGELDSASTYADKVLDSSHTSTNATGLLTAHWIYAQIARAREEESAAVLFQEAIALAEKSGNRTLLKVIQADYFAPTPT